MLNTNELAAPLKRKRDYSPHLKSTDPFWLDFWCNRKSNQQKILHWIKDGGLDLQNFLDEERMLAYMFGEGHA